MKSQYLGWGGVVRLGLVQSALGGMVAFAVSTLNRVMVVEEAMPAVLPAAFIAWHYVVQLSRPRWGYGSDIGERRTPWIIGGMGVVALGLIIATDATLMMDRSPLMAIALSVVAFSMIGGGVGAAGTSLLALLASRVAPERRPAAASITWMLMIAGIVVCAGASGALLQPFSGQRLAMVASGVAAVGFMVTLAAVWRAERDRDALEIQLTEVEVARRPTFREAIAEIRADPISRRFTIFVFVSMLAYSAQELILEPFAGLVFHMNPGQSAQLNSIQHGGVLLGMILVGVLGARFGDRKSLWMRRWTVGGCVGSAVALSGLGAASLAGPSWPLSPTVFVLGLANGVFAVSAIGSMMGLAGAGRNAREGVRMGVWGAAQAGAFAVGGFLGAFGVGALRGVLHEPGPAFLIVFVIEALIFLVAAVLAGDLRRPSLVADAAQAAGEYGLRRGAVMTGAAEKTYDVVVVGGGPSGATAAADLAAAGRSVLLLDRAGRIKPCGGAIPPRLIRDFDIPDELLVARARSARMIAPSAREVDMPIEGGFVGMVDREIFDEWLRERAAGLGAERRVGMFERLERDGDGAAVICYRPGKTSRGGDLERVRARSVIGADGARSELARQTVKGAEKTHFVFAYHEIVRSPDRATAGFDGSRCDVFYQGELSPDFYAWIFPHGDTASIGVGSAQKGFSLRKAVDRLRAATALTQCETIRTEGAPIPLKPLPRWDNGRDVVLAGDAAGVVAPASGEGIYYAMIGGRLAANAVEEFLTTSNPRRLAGARRQFMRAHGKVFWVLGIMQYFWYSSDKRRERFVSMCADPDVQKLTWQAYMNKELVRADPAAHARIFFKDMGHLLGLSPS